jgi:hypothetical protein
MSLFPDHLSLESGYLRPTPYRGSDVRPLLSDKEECRLQQESEVANAYEDHEVGFHRGLVFGGFTSYRELPSIVGICGLCFSHLGCHAGGWREQVPLGGWILRNCRAFQSRRSGGAFSQDISLAGLGLPHDLSSLTSYAEEATDTFYGFDYQSDAGKRLPVELRASAHTCEKSTSGVPQSYCFFVQEVDSPTDSWSRRHLQR